jgi:Icc-related predicted phosphoesterase
VIRIAAIGDLHVGNDCPDPQPPMPELRRVSDDADLLLLAGDLTKCGGREEAACLARTLRDVAVPVLAVLGNHDYHADEAPAVMDALREARVHVLEDGPRVVHVRGVRVGVAGTKGFGGGFVGACGSDFGEPEMKRFIRHTQALATRLEHDLAVLRDGTDLRIAVLHYAPIPETLQGERLEIYPFLGSYLLGEAIDRAGADLVVHGHAHAGTERGVTAGGIRVRNVALPVIRQPYRVFEFAAAGDAVPTAPARHDGAPRAD